MIFFVYVKMSYYWFNRHELLQKTNDKYYNCGGKEKAAAYYIASKDVIKKQEKIIEIFQKKTKKAKTEYGKNRCKNKKKC